MKFPNFIASAFFTWIKSKWKGPSLDWRYRAEHQNVGGSLTFFFFFLCYLSPIDSRRLFIFWGTGESAIDFSVCVCSRPGWNAGRFGMFLSAATFYGASGRNIQMRDVRRWVADADVGRLSGTNWLPFFICFRVRGGSFLCHRGTFTSRQSWNKHKSIFLFIMQMSPIQYVRWTSD
jgi:hypothetical protein